MVSVVPAPSTSRPRLIGPHVELLLVLGFIWAALGAYSLTDRTITLADVAVEKTDIKQLLGLGAQSPAPSAAVLPKVTATSARMAPAAGTAPSPIPSATASAGPVLPPLDDKPQRILIFGDSMVVNLIPPLADYCLENGHKLFPVIWYASTTVAWAAQSKLSDVIREFSPTYVIVVLGASELGARKVKKRALSVRMINERIGKRHFFWLGPPNWREDTGFNAMVLGVVGKTHFFPSADIVFERESDGIHPTPAAGRKWVGLFARWMSTEAAVRIPMKRPTKKALAPSAKVYPPPYKVTEEYLRRKRLKKER